MEPKQRILDLSCSRCGFRVYNRRYPKCERCGCALPASLLLSDQERQALRKQGEEQLNLELEHLRRRRSRAPARSDVSQTAREQSSSTASVPGDWSSAGTSADTFTSGGGGMFDGGGASGSFGSDSGGSSGGDGS